MLLGIVTNPPRGKSRRFSESEHLARIGTLISNAIEELEVARRNGESADSRRVQTIMRFLRDAWKMTQELGDQVERGVHVNGRGRKMSDHVQAIVYKHVEDGRLYCHGFGDADINLKTSRGGALTIEGLHDTTGVQALAQPDGSVIIRHRDGEPIWEDIR